ncbi:MAG: aspartate carbamoyltransferase [Defluviitaleaceae bacterium]|nr:aspartate carbamoyltransferase [Defluviitaleaceae bacterium]
MRHILSCEQFSQSDLAGLFDLADEIRANPRHYADSLSDKVVATLFYEPSTRTRLSFEAAIVRLGGKNISTENAREMSSAIKGESLADTIRVVHGYADAIIMRHQDNNSANEAAAASRVPIINAGAGSGEHPTQALLDIYTIKRRKGGIDNISVAILGDLLYGRTIHSLIKLLSLYKNVEIFGLSIPSLPLPAEYVNYMADRGIIYQPVKSLADLPPNLDIIYQTRTQLERFATQGLAAEEIILNNAEMARFPPDTLVLHPLPRNREIAPEFDTDPRAAYFDQSENGMYIRMALLHKILTK